MQAARRGSEPSLLSDQVRAQLLGLSRTGRVAQGGSTVPGGALWRSLVPARARNQGYSDPAGDADAGAPDIVAVAAVNDTSGNLAFGISYANRTCVGAGDFLSVFLDVDQNPSTGATGIGAEYALVIDGTTRTAPASRSRAFLPSWAALRPRARRST
jgi:hypothetical protein